MIFVCGNQAQAESENWQQKLTLEQKLAAFDPVLHGGEVMATGVVGKEIR